MRKPDEQQFPAGDLSSKQLLMACLRKAGKALIILFTSFTAYSQRERVYLDLDKYSCKAGDTVWFKGFIFQGTRPSELSTNLYVELLTGRGLLVERTLWPIIHGQSTGQLVLANSLPTDNYYVVALTKQQLNYDTARFFSVPLLVYNREKLNVVKHKVRVENSPVVTAGRIKGIYWATSFSRGQLSSMLELDSGSIERKFRLVQWTNTDSFLTADIAFDSGHRSKLADFPVDTTRAKGNESLLLYEDSILIGRQVLPVSRGQPIMQLSADTLNVMPDGYNSWNLKMPDSAVYQMSISISDADLSGPSPVSIEELREPYTDDFTIVSRLVDSSFIAFSGKATKENFLFGGKNIKDPLSREIVMTGVRDSTFIFLRTADMDDAGDFSLDSLFFFGNIELQFQINKEEDGSTKNVRLTLAKFVPPIIDSSCFVEWVDAGLPMGRADTLFTEPELSRYELAKLKMLKAAVVTHWESPRKELDHAYTWGGFSEPSMYSFDVRTERRVHDIGSYLRMQLGMQGGFGDDTPSLDGHSIVWFVDQEPYSWPELEMFDWDRIAYIKVLNSDFLIDDPFIKWKTGLGGFDLAGSGPLKIPVGNTPYEVCIYLRKGKDFRTMPGGLNKIAVKGYEKILPFKPGKVTLFWDPWAAGREYRIRFTNNETTKHFRVNVDGMTRAGKVVHYETVIE
jgi:hypothetical protein